MTITEVDASRVVPHLDELRAEGLLPDADDGIWLAAEVEGQIAGLARILERGGLRMLEDVWVRAELRKRGIGTQLVAEAARRRDDLWLICDEPDVSFYARRGFQAVEPEAFPEPFLPLYTRKGLWPATDHVHVAMVRRA